MAKRKKPKQTKMKGQGFDNPEAVPAIEEAAENYVDLRDERMGATKKEVQARTVLIHEMQEHGRTEYRYEGRVITLSSTDKVKVRTEGDDTDEEIEVEEAE